MFRLFLFGLLFTSCGIIAERNGFLFLTIETDHSVSDDFTVTRLSTGEVAFEDDDRFFPNRNFEDSVVVMHPQGITDTFFIDLKHRKDKAYVFLKPSQMFLDSIAEEERQLELRLTMITDCGVSINENDYSNVVKPTDFVLEEVAIYPGGMEAMANDLSQNIRYPDQALDEGISGKVYLRFVIDTKGLIKCAQVLKGIPNCPDCEREALIGLTYLKIFTPAKNSGVVVNSWYTLPISFNLQ